jgi:hypothetical protein
MGLEDLLHSHQKEIKEYTSQDIAEYYQNLANRYGLISFPSNDSFAVIADEELALAASSESPLPRSGIKIHAPFSEEIKNLLMDYDFQNMLINRKVGGIKIFLVDYPKARHKWLTIYMPTSFLPHYGELINIFEKNGISINPQVDKYSDGKYEISRIYISPEKGVFVRYSPYFTAQALIPDIEIILSNMLMNIKTEDLNQAKIYIKTIDDFIKETYWNKISDDRWRDAEDTYAKDRGHTRIFAVSRSWLSENERILDYLLHDPSAIYTFITLKEIGGTIVPNPNIIISYDDHKKLLEAYNVFDAKIVRYDLSNGEDLERIGDHPEYELNAFLRYGTVY